MQLTAPEGDVFEISIFSRGYGESIVVHLGRHRWVIIDSLLTSEGTPAGLDYLEAIGVPVESAVQAVLITHWHDDHIGGAHQLVERCETAVIAMSGALKRDEFYAFMSRTETSTASSFGSGVQELLKILRSLLKTGRRPAWVWANREISVSRGSHPYRFVSLSPSDADFERFVEELSSWGAPAGRIMAPLRNDASVASVLECGEDMILLGADLEATETGRGWAAVCESAWGDRPKASFYKIAHHGSRTGEHPSIWADLLVKNVTAALTPWSRGRKLPTSDDVARIIAYSNDAHAAAKVRGKKRPNRNNTVERALRDSGIVVESRTEDVGHVRFRKTSNGKWNVAYVSGDSCHLTDVSPER